MRGAGFDSNQNGTFGLCYGSGVAITQNNSLLGDINKPARLYLYYLSKRHTLG